MMAVLDTSVLVATDVPPLAGELAVRTASIAELHFGVLMAASPEVRADRLRRLVAVERAFVPLPVDAGVASSYGRLAASVAQSGRQPRALIMDLLIAATAHAHAAVLYTRNARDLTGIGDLVEIVTV